MKSKYIIYVLLLCTSCKSNDKSQTITSDTVIAFLKWYNVNIKTVGNINMVNNNGNTVVDSTKLYSVNFDSTEKYLSLLNKSGFVSEKYIVRMRKYFKHADEDFKTNPQYDGPPEAFDYDLIMCSQEYDDDLKNLDEVKVKDETTLNGTSVLSIEFPSKMKLQYYLSNTDGKWQIDDIKNITSYANDYMKALNE